MSARPAHIRVKTLSGVAICGRCGEWTSFERRCEEMELRGVRCASCRSGDVTLWHGSFWATLEITNGHQEGA